jgi:hypothetical protein
VKTKKTTVPVQGGTAMVDEFARLLLELAVLNPKRLEDVGRDLAKAKRNRRTARRS